jgi:hypothetical protein
MNSWEIHGTARSVENTWNQSTCMETPILLGGKGGWGRGRWTNTRQTLIYFGGQGNGFIISESQPSSAASLKCLALECKTWPSDAVCEHEMRCPVNSALTFFCFRVPGRILPRTYSFLTTVKAIRTLWRKEDTHICGINYLVSCCAVL